MGFLSCLFGRRKLGTPPEPPPEGLLEPPQISRRPLTSGEAAILRIVQEEYGPQNTEEDVSFTPAREAHLVIKAPGGGTITTISLSSFVWAIERGEVNEQDLRNDWIRDSRSVLARYCESNPSLFRLASSGRQCDLILIAGARMVEVSYDLHRNGETFEYVFYANSMRRWHCPFDAEPLTRPLKEDIFGIIMKLLEAKDRVGRLEVEIKW